MARDTYTYHALSDIIRLRGVSLSEPGRQSCHVPEIGQTANSVVCNEIRIRSKWLVFQLYRNILGRTLVIMMMYDQFYRATQSLKSPNTVSHNQTYSSG